MFIWDFVGKKTLTTNKLNLLTDYSILVEFFGMIKYMRAELFNFIWVKLIVLFFNNLAWAMFTVGLILSVFETAITHQNDQINISKPIMNVLKGFMASSVVTTLPIALFKFAISMQVSLSLGLTKLTNEIASIVRWL